MEAFVYFVKEYGTFILAALSAVLGFICLVVKRRPKTLNDFFQCCDEVALKIPVYISQFESKFGSGHGTDKKTAVLTSCFDILRTLLGRDLDKNESDYSFKLFSGFIEKVLETPQRKEVFK